MEIGADTYDQIPAVLLEELSDIAFFQIDLDRRITSWSPGVTTILGFGESDFIGLDVREIFTPEDRELGQDEDEFRRAQEAGRSPDLRWHLRKDGSRVFLDGVLKAVRSADETLAGYYKIMRDTNPQRAKHGVWRAIFERTPDVIYSLDRDGRFIFVNSQAARLFGRSVEEVIGQHPDDLLPPQISSPLRDHNQKVFDQGAPVTTEERLGAASDGSDRTFLSGKAPWHDSDGNAVGVVSISQDITSRKKIEEASERLMQQLRRSNDTLAEFSYVVSHDLQTPLRAISSYTQLLAQRYRGNLDGTADEFISFILQGAKSMEELIRSLLRYAEAGEERITRTAVRLDAVLDGVRSNLQSLLYESGAKLICPSLPVVMGDPVQLLQLFQNLVSNAIKYARPAVRPEVAISFERHGVAGYRFAIEDNGMGIDERNFEHVFAPLRRLHGEEIPGSGIGLAICRKIVERHDGQIWLTSEVGEGSTFYFTIADA